MLQLPRDCPSETREGPVVPNEVRDTAAKQRRGCEASGHGFAKQNHGTWPRDCFFIMSARKERGKR